MYVRECFQWATVDSEWVQDRSQRAKGVGKISRWWHARRRPSPPARRHRWAGCRFGRASEESQVSVRARE